MSACSLFHIRARGPAEGSQLKSRGLCNAMQCNRNMVRCAWRMDVHISPLFRLLLQIPYKWHRRSSDQVAVDVRFYLFAFNSSTVFKGIHAGQVYPERRIQKRHAPKVSCSRGLPRKRTATYQPTGLSAELLRMKSRGVR